MHVKSRLSFITVLFFFLFFLPNSKYSKTKYLIENEPLYFLNLYTLQTEGLQRVTILNAILYKQRGDSIILHKCVQ